MYIWTKEQPKISGFYWRKMFNKKGIANKPDIVEVLNIENDIIIFPVHVPEDVNLILYAGPIELPTELGSIGVSTSVDNISFYVDQDQEELIIFHNSSKASLMKFSFNNKEFNNQKIFELIKQHLSKLDWTKDFDKVFKSQEHRMAIMKLREDLQ